MDRFDKLDSETDEAQVRELVVFCQEMVTMAKTLTLQCKAEFYMYVCSLFFCTHFVLHKLLTWMVQTIGRAIEGDRVVLLEFAGGRWRISYQTPVSYQTPDA